MSSVRTRKRGKYWEYEFDAAKIDGKRKKISKSGFKTKAEAVAAGTQAMAEYNNSGVAFIPSEMSYSDFLDYWMESYCSINLKKTTLDNYKKRIRIHIKPALGMYKLAALNTVCLQNFINDKIRDKYSLNTLSVLRGILSGSLHYAVRQNLLKFNPANEIKIPVGRRNDELRLRTAPHVYIPPERMKEIFERFPERHPAHLPIMLGYKCGLRIGEVYALTWDCVDLDEGTILINKQVQWSPERQVWFFTKPKFNSVRCIEVDDELLALFKREKDRQERAKEFYQDLYIRYVEDENRGIILLKEQDENSNILDVVMRRDDGSYTQARTMQHASSVIHHEIGFGDFTFHSLRHTHATMLAENGLPQKYTQIRLGHKDIQVTLKYYTHLTEKMKALGKSILNGMYEDKED